MSTPQAALFAALQDSTCFQALEYRTRPGVGGAALRAALRELPPVADGPVWRLLGFGVDAWRALAPDAVPESLIPFHTVHGAEGRDAIGTQGDLLVWLHAARRDQLFDSARAVDAALAGVAHRELDVAGFRYRDDLDLTGFPVAADRPPSEQQTAAALVPDGEVGAGGSFVLSQKWVHRLQDFLALPLEEQERIRGRRRRDGAVLEPLPVDSHAARTQLIVDGRVLRVFSRGFAYGNLEEQGWYSLAFSAELIRFAMMLDRMFGCAGDGHYDRWTDYSTPVTSSYWFAPAAESLNRVLRDS